MEGGLARGAVRRARLATAAALSLVLVASGCVVASFDPARIVTADEPMSLAMQAVRTDGGSAPVAGEGVLRITLSAPGTDWGPDDTAVVLDAAVAGRPAQQIVVFAGGARRTYEGFTGPLDAGTAYPVHLRVRDDLSSVAGGTEPAVSVHRVELAVVPPSDPMHRVLAHAPVLYGRAVSAHSDTPIMRFARDQATGGGGRRITYTEVFSNEDGGTGVFPGILFGAWGRTTDIETSVVVDLDASGAVSGATFQGCAACPPAFPEDQTGLDHTDLPFAGAWFGTHPVVRAATSNNVFDDDGTTAFRFQPVPGPPPPAGEVREAVMDDDPELWEVMHDEMRRERTALGDYNLNPLNGQVGDARQYAIVDLDTTPTGTSAVGVDLQLAGSSTWYRNDFGSNSSLFYERGHERTAVKLPLDWHDRELASMRLRLVRSSPGASPSITVHRVQILELADDYTVSLRPVPAIEVVTVG